jgi:hypothetical protein
MDDYLGAVKLITSMVQKLDAAKYQELLKA